MLERLGSVATRVDEKTGELKDETSRNLIKQQLESFAKFIARHGAWNRTKKEGGDAAIGLIESEPCDARPFYNELLERGELEERLKAQ